MRLSDTHPKIEKMMIEGYRKMTPAEKIKRIVDLNYTLELFVLAEIRRRYPNISVRECQLRAASRRIPKELMLRVFDWNVEEKGY